jgi:tetratricopeptide (TPR) repeat protein
LTRGRAFPARNGLAAPSSELAAFRSAPRFSDLNAPHGDCYNGWKSQRYIPPNRALKFLPIAFAVLILTVFGPATGHASEPNVQELVQSLQDEWAEIFYRLPEDRQAEKFEELLPRVRAVAERYPKQAEPLVMEAIVLCTYAAAEFGLNSLRKVERARDLLIKAIATNPRAMEGSAYITLGNLYYRLPGWPISYGDEDLGRQYLEAALKLFPDALDANYFYGDFLLNQGEFKQALPYLEKADRAAIRPTVRLSDLKLKDELRKALQAAREQNDDRADFFTQLMPAFGGEDRVH